jgi:GNAT superfamily N-acetyltransferase
MGPTYQEEFDSRMAQVREDITESYVYDYGDEYRNQATQDLGLDADAFNEVYGTSHTGMTPDGREVTLQASVENVYRNQWDESIDIDGTIYDADGNWAGEFQRKFFRDESGDMVVEHALLRIEDDYQGTGFSKVFNRTAENYYISHGVNKVDIHAALDVGGYAWAKQGFDWAPKGGATSNVKRQFDDVLSSPSLPASVRRSGESLRTRLDLPTSDPDYPTPREVASWGYVQGASTWPGKQTLLGSDWYGQKSLTPSGPRQSTTQQEAAATVAEVPGQMTLPGVVS